MASKAKKEVLAPVSNGADEMISGERPYRVEVKVRGTAAILFHAWNNEAVAEKASAAKGSKTKKSDNLESYVNRDEKGYLAIPGDYLRGSLMGAAKYKQDPRSPRKSLMDLAKAIIIVETLYASTGVKDWDYVDRRRVTIQKNAVTRERPALREGWEATFYLTVLRPAFIPPSLLQQLLSDAGMFVGLGDFRPTFGRFGVSHFEVIEEV